MSEWPQIYRRRWPDRKQGPWDLTLHLDVVDGTLACVGLDVDPMDDASSAFTTADLRRLALGRLLDEAQLELWGRGPLGYGRYGDDRQHIGCPRAVTDMTACVARDGRLATADDGNCVGCDGNPADLLSELVRAVTEKGNDA